MQKELAKKFEEATSCQSVNINSLDRDKTYPIVRAKRITSEFGPTVLLAVRESESTTVQIFLPKGYSAVVLNDDIEKINNKVVSLSLINMGICEKARSYLLKIEM